MSGIEAYAALRVLRASPADPAARRHEAPAPQRFAQAGGRLRPDWEPPDRTVCLANMRQVADRPWDLAALVPAAKTILITALLLGLSLGVFTLITLEAAVCTFSSTLAPGTCS